MWIKSSFTIPAVVAMSFCVIGGTVPAVADIDGRVSATTRIGGVDSGPDAGAISAGGTEASQADINGRVSATTRSGGADYGPSGGTALSGAGCGPVDQTQLSSNVCMAFFSQTDLAQSFTTTATLLCGARIDLVPNTGGADVTIALWDGLPNAGGNLLGSGTDFAVPDGGFAIVSFGGGVPVNPGNRYFLVFTAANGNPCIAGDTRNPYPGGHVYATAGYTPFPNFDYTFETYGTACPADFDNSGDVGVKDLLFLLGAWGPCPTNCPADFDNSGDVGVKDLLFLLGAWGPCPAPQFVYSHEFVNGVIYCPGDPQYDDWLSYRRSLPTSGVTSITLSGSQDPIGRTCSDPTVAQQIADAMRTGSSLSVACGGFTWRVSGNCQTGCGLPDNDLVLSVGGETCFCTSTYHLLPGIGNENWGGITGGSCFAPTQTMTVTIE